jgi:hypothetical protein
MRGLGVGLFISVVTLLGVLSLLVARDVQLQSDLADLHKGVCSYRAGLLQSAANTRAFVRKHPHGLPQFDLTAGQLLQQANRQDKAAGSFRGLRCH